MQPLGPHFAPLGVKFYRSELGGMFPATYDRTLFVAIHGSWNRALFSGYKVAAIRLYPNNTVASYQPFIEGFLQGQNTPGNSIWGERGGAACSRAVTAGWCCGMLIHAAAVVLLRWLWGLPASWPAEARHRHDRLMPATTAGAGSKLRHVADPF